MSDKLKFLPRTEINTDAWDACVAASAQRIIYAYTWYLDAVLPRLPENGPSWQWIGLVLAGKEGRYEAVMPIPLRRKQIVGILHGWVVHQPLFCQILGIFSRNVSLDLTPFLQAVQQRFRYGSTFSIRSCLSLSTAPGVVHPQMTHVIDLAVGYNTIYQQYTRDRKRNLRLGQAANWLIMDSTDPRPLIDLFRNNHADNIEGGVGDWAYVIFSRLFDELNRRGLITLRYAIHGGQIEAGGLFVREGNRIIYLFNAASVVGRRGNARTLLIDQIIREYAGRQALFDFESPLKPSIRDFYRSFGATEDTFQTIRWNRLSRVPRTLLAVLKMVGNKLR